jgi:hypothetical protein
MKLDYHIIWIDDTPDWVQSIEPSLRRHFDELGFRLTIEHRTSGDDENLWINDPEADLFVIDFNLPKQNGKELIDLIRKRDVFTEIVFYSQDSPRKKFEVAPDGVYFSSREDAEDRIKRVIELALKRESSISYVRGVVIAETIDLEVRLGELLIRSFGEKGDLFATRILEHDGLFDFGKKFAVLNGIVKDRLTEANKIAQLTAQQAQLQGVAAAEVVKAVEKAATLKKLKEELNAFDNDVIKTRNMLAHVRKSRDADGKVMLKAIKKGYPDIIVTEEWFRQTRKSLIRHAENLEALFAHL